MDEVTQFFRAKISAHLQINYTVGKNQPFAWVIPHMGPRGKFYLGRSFFTPLNFDLNVKDNIGSTAFHLACQSGNPTTVELILDFSKISDAIDLNATDNAGKTGFHLACDYGPTETVKLILNFSKENDAIDLNATDFEAMTGFHWACRNGQTEIVNLILDFSQENKSIDLNARDRQGKTGFTWLAISTSYC